MTSTIKGAVIVNAYWRGGDACAKEISERLSLVGLTAPLIKTTDLFAYIDGGARSSCPLDFAVFSDKDYAVARLLEESGVRLFNGADAIRLADDKMLTHLSLLQAGVPMPKTIPSPLFFAGEDDPFFLKNVVGELGFPLVVKNCFGAFGRQVFLAHNEKELFSLREKLLREPHLYQEYIECGASDIRVIVIGGKAVAAMRRKAAKEGEFRANAELGGTGEKLELSAACASLAEKAASAIGLCYAGVDLIEKEGSYLLIEINSNAHFKLIEQVTGVSVAGKYAEYILREMTKTKR